MHATQQQPDIALQSEHYGRMPGSESSASDTSGYGNLQLVSNDVYNVGNLET
jgi:hypothetical protein